ncbi:MAG: hypothetical protein LJE88_17480 [Deltaproteobacteria bacterium]|nr:hypothetical protein [Deltaproteobacteria bacterium]
MTIAKKISLRIKLAFHWRGPEFCQTVEERVCMISKHLCKMQGLLIHLGLCLHQPVTPDIPCIAVARPWRWACHLTTVLCYRGIGSEAYLNGTSQGMTPEDARKDGHIRGRSRGFMKYPG